MEKKKKTFYKKWWFWVIVVAVVCVIFGSGGSENDSSKNTGELTEAGRIAENNIAESDEEVVEEAVDEAEETDISIEEANANADIKAETNGDAEKEALKDKENLVWFGDVQNDVTGKWRLSEYASSDTQETFAVEYYNAFFESDDEIHAVINFTNNTTGKISKIMDDTLDVTIQEYVDGEEHDANELFSGMLLKEYWVTISTGEIEVIQ
jgi:hypothetical protein